MKKLKIYLDNCCFNRPYDDQTHLGVFLETQAKIAIQEIIKNGEINLVWSFILDFENKENPDETIRNEIFFWRKIAINIINRNESIVHHAKAINKLGFGNKDSLHIAAAISGNIDFFITVDKGILREKIQ